jgi:hypothetical protein
MLTTFRAVISLFLAILLTQQLHCSNYGGEVSASIVIWL